MLNVVDSPDRKATGHMTGAPTNTNTSQATSTEGRSDTGSTPRPGFPVSIKGVVVRDGRVVLLRNERDEWELPGGRLEPGETPEQCVVREIHEETGWNAEAGPLLDAWVYHVLPTRDVFIVTYGCHTDATHAPVRSSEHSELGLFTEEEVSGLRMPDNYKQTVAAWFAHLRTTPGR